MILLLFPTYCDFPLTRFTYLTFWLDDPINYFDDDPINYRDDDLITDFDDVARDVFFVISDSSFLVTYLMNSIPLLYIF